MSSLGGDRGFRFFGHVLASGRHGAVMKLASFECTTAVGVEFKRSDLLLVELAENHHPWLRSAKLAPPATSQQ
jgi:hypothetical protein